jgi:phage-related protein (TIGR01555 family)
VPRLSPLRRRTAAARRDSLYLDPFSGGGGAENGSNTVVNLLTGLGTRGADASVYDQFRRPRWLGDMEVEALLVNALGKRIADLPAFEACREGFDLKATRAPNELVAARVAQYVSERSAELDLLGTLREARYLSRGYGSAIVVAGTSDMIRRDDLGKAVGVSLAGPPDPGARVVWLRTYDSRRWRILSYGPAWSPRFGQATSYAVRSLDWPEVEADYRPCGPARGGGAIPSRYAAELPIHGTRAWRDSTDDGYSIFDGLARDLARLLSGARGAEQALGSSGVGVYKIDNLAEKTRKDEAGVRAHIEAVDSARSFMNALILDRGHEDFDFKASGALSGVSDTIYSLGYLLSAATGIPMTLLFGMSPGGFSGGESEERNWVNYVRSVQRELERGVRRIVDLLVAEFAAEHPDVLPTAEAYEYEVIWNSLVVLSAAEEVDMRDKAAITAGRLVEAGVVQPREIRASMFGGGQWSYEIALDKTLDDDADRGQANLGAGEFASALALLQAYYAPGSSIPEGAARALLASADPALLNVADKIILPRTPAEAAATAGAPTALQLANEAAGLPVGGEAPAAPIVEVDAPPGATWLPADVCAARAGCTPAAVKRFAVEGLVASRPGGPRGARLYALEHLQEHLEGATRDRTAQEYPALAELDAAAPEPEHVAAQADPSGYSRFRRKVAAPGVALVLGRADRGGWEAVQVRLAAERFSEAEAKAWLEEHGFEAGDFAAAVEAEAAPPPDGD